MMIEDHGTTDLRKDELSLTSAVNGLEEDTCEKVNSKQQIPPNKVNENASCSSVFESSDPLSIKPESHSMSFITSVSAKRYKITLAQARRMALSAVKRARRRRACALENEEDT